MFNYTTFLIQFVRGYFHGNLFFLVSIKFAMIYEVTLQKKKKLPENVVFAKDDTRTSLENDGVGNLMKNIRKIEKRCVRHY